MVIDCLHYIRAKMGFGMGWYLNPDYKYKSAKKKFFRCRMLNSNICGSSKPIYSPKAKEALEAAIIRRDKFRKERNDEIRNHRAENPFIRL